MSRHIWEERFRKKKEFETWYRENAYLMHVPETMLGDEMNTIRFDWESAFADGTLEDHFRVALVDINASAAAICSPALRLFYQELHEHDPSWIVERFFCPVSEHNYSMLDENGFSYLSLEGRMPFDAFHVICCSQQLIGDEVNLIGMLLDSEIPVYSRDRTEKDPIIIRGGASSYNPSVIMDVCDLFFMGEGEGVLAELLSMIQQGLGNGLSREEILLEAVRKWDCLWAPCFYEQRFDESGNLLGMKALREDVPEKIKYNSVRDLDDCFIVTKPIVNFSYAAVMSEGVEITRGCEGMCGFCVSGHTYMPFRARSVDCVIRNARENLHNSGTEKILMSSFSGMSYPYLNELTVRIHDEIGESVGVMSLRLDTVRENPEFCSLIQRQGKTRIVFGMEGISQRLRQLTSKNCSEELILETVRMVCRSGYRKVKFMLISGLPGESDEDMEELVRLTEKINRIKEEETREGAEPPVIQYSWTPLKIFPFTPFQWFEARPQTDLLPDDIRQRLLDMGVIVSDEQPAGYIHDAVLTQLLLFGDRRLQDMLIDMAKSGIRRHLNFDQRAHDFADEWISGHDVPDYDTWFAAKDYEYVFPWDFIDAGASREHLWKRYLDAAGKDPKDFPRCLERCQGCGACSAEHQKEMEKYRQKKKADRCISLGNVDPDGRAADQSLRYAVLRFHTDVSHRFVRRFYWMNELRRDLDHAGIRFDRSSVRVFKPYNERYDWFDGLRIADLKISDELPDEELLERLNANSIHMRFTDIEWVDHQPEDIYMSFSIPCPEDTDEEALKERIAGIMDGDSWPIRMDLLSEDRERTVDADVRNQIRSLELCDHSVCMNIKQGLPPYTVYQNLLEIPWEKAGQYLPVCTDVEYN